MSKHDVSVWYSFDYRTCRYTNLFYTIKNYWKLS